MLQINKQSQTSSAKYGIGSSLTGSVFSATALAILALSAGTSLAAPADTPKNSTPGHSPNDQIYKNLADAGHLHWEDANGGKKATILKEHWDAAAAKVSARSISQPDSSLLSRDSGGDIEGLATSLSCYARGAVAQDSQIQAFTLQACDALVGANVPKPVKNALQVWQSSDFADVNGIAGYLRYSFEILTDVADMPDVQLCTGAMNMFAALCQAGSLLEFLNLHGIGTFLADSASFE